MHTATKTNLKTLDRLDQEFCEITNLKFEERILTITGWTVDQERFNSLPFTNKYQDRMDLSTVKGDHTGNKERFCNIPTNIKYKM